MRQATVLGLLACVLAAASMVTVQATRTPPRRTLLGRPLHLDALGCPEAGCPARQATRSGRRRADRPQRLPGRRPEDARLAQRPATPARRWARFSHGAARPNVIRPRDGRRHPAEDRAVPDRRPAARASAPGAGGSAHRGSRRASATTAPSRSFAATRSPRCTSPRLRSSTPRAGTSRRRIFAGRCGAPASLVARAPPRRLEACLLPT